MKTRHVVFLVIALILTAAALVCALLSNTFVRGLNETQDKENDSVGEAVGTAAGALVFVIFGLVFLVASFLLALPAMIFAIVNIRGRARCARASQGVVHTARARGASPYRARVPIFFARVKRSVFSCENMRA